MTLHALASKILATVRRSGRDAELDEEIESHLAMLAAKHAARGMSAAEARLAARREFGGIEATKQSYREQRGLNFAENVLQDLRLSLRSLMKNRGFAAIAIGSLAIGIGANTSMFSVVRALKFRSLPVPRPQELVQVRSFSPQYKSFVSTFSYPFVKELAQTDLFYSAAAMFPTSVALFTDGQTSQIAAELVTGDYFRTLGIKPALGRLLTPADMRNPGADSVCTISYSLWQSRFGGKADVLRRSVLLNGQRFLIVGVTQRGFEGSVLYWRHDMQIPVSMTAEFMHDFPWQSANSTFLYTVARLNPGMTMAAADARLKVIGPQVGSKIRDVKNPDQTALWNRFSLTHANQGPGFMEDRSLQVSLVSGVVVLTLLIACANIACLLLARASAQERETAVQISLGAPRARIMQRYLVESVLLTAAGGVVGLMASRWLMRLFTYVLKIEYLEVEPDTGMLLFSMAACVVTALLFGVFPGWQASRVKAQFVGLREHGSARTTRSQSVLRRALVAVQTALATVLLIGCALFLRSLQKVQAVSLGFDPRNVFIVDLDPAKAGRSNAKSLEIYRAVLERVRLLPDVESASLEFGTPLSGNVGQASFSASKVTEAKVPDRIIAAVTVEEDFFRTLHLPVLLGRDFEIGDLKKERSIIVNQAFVDYYQLGKKTVGRRIKFDKDSGEVEIVGVVGNAKMQSVREEGVPALYSPVTDDFRGQLSLVVRARQPQGSVLREIRTVAEAVDSQTPIGDERQYEDLVSAQYFDQRAIGSLCSLFSIFAVLLSCMGLYGVAAYSIARRRQEIGVRFALGAMRRDVARLFLRESCGMIVLGLAAGMPAALALGSLVRTLLYGVEPADPLTLSMTGATLTVTCLIAAALPLRNAFRVDPAEALKGE